MKRVVIPTLIVTITLLAYRQATSQPTGRALAETMDRSAAATYEHLASAIIAIEATEDELVKSILLGYHAAAQNHLSAAAEAPGRREHLEAAAAEIVNIANEGDKRIQAVRQRLAKAGHTHNTDEATKEDYLFINSREKKALLALAQRVGQMGARGPGGRRPGRAEGAGRGVRQGDRPGVSRAPGTFRNPSGRSETSNPKLNSKSQNLKFQRFVWNVYRSAPRDSGCVGRGQGG